MTYTPPAKATAYLWRAAPAEPGLLLERLEATNSANPPAPIPPVAAIDGDVAQPAHTFGAWSLIGTTHATAHRDAYDQALLQMWLPTAYGVTVSVAEVLRNRWFTAAS